MKPVRLILFSKPAPFQERFQRAVPDAAIFNAAIVKEEHE
jgi:hypothetical protein